LQRTLPESIEINFEADPSEYIVAADPTRIAQVIMNLAVNARDAMPEGGSLHFDMAHMEFISAKVTPLAGMPAGNWVRISVADTGTGMSDDVLAHLFEPFFTTKSPGQGTGLGLAQVYGIVHQHKGYIAVSSQEGAGTTFHLYLPSLGPARDSRQAVPLLGEMAHGQGERILLVEDDSALRTALVELLTLWNYQVEEASNGEEALASLLEIENPVDLILSDMVMPRMGGAALFRSLLHHNLAIPMILLTGYPMYEELESLKASGLRAWLSKPVDTQQLAETVAAVLHHTKS
jgi:CheY-like chemotaxis protein